MGIVRSIFSIIVFLLLALAPVLAQELPQVHKINGEKYYLHIVEQGNTLYAISKQYNTSIEEIQVHNPVISEVGLKVNQTLLIPVTKENKRELGGLVEQSTEFLSHEVQPKETLYAISRKYETTLNALLKANPEVEQEGLKQGSIIKIPMAKVDVREEEYIEPATPDSLERHIVKKGETLYSLSKQHEVEIDALERANDGLPFGLKEGMALRIPGKRVDSLRTTELVRNKVKKVDSILKLKPDSSASLKIALLLPFNPSFPDSGKVDAFKINEIQRVALSFYRGFLFSIDSLSKTKGEKVDVKVLDGGKDTFRIREILRSKVLDSVEVVVGPFFTDQFELLADVMALRGVPVICPVPKPSKILFKRPNAIKTTPSESMQLDALASFIGQNYRDSNVVVVNSNKFQDQDNVEFFKSRLAVTLGVPDTFLSDVVHEIKLWDINNETLGMRFKDSASYTLVVPSADKVFVTKLLGGLYNFQYESEGAFRFRVIGMEEWYKYEQDLEVSYLHALRVTLPLTAYVDYDDYKVRAFLVQYKKAKGFEPNRFEMMGFDLGDYLLTQAFSQKRKWFKQPERFQYNGLLMDLHFTRVIPTSGIENQSVTWYQYDAYRLKRFAQWPQQKIK